MPSIQPDHADAEPSIIVLSYVLQLTAQPGIEMEIPLIVTSLGYRQQQAPAAFVRQISPGPADYL